MYVVQQEINRVCNGLLRLLVDGVAANMPASPEEHEYQHSLGFTAQRKQDQQPTSVGEASLRRKIPVLSHFLTKGLGLCAAVPIAHTAQGPGACKGLLVRVVAHT